VIRQCRGGLSAAAFFRPPGGSTEKAAWAFRPGSQTVKEAQVKRRPLFSNRRGSIAIMAALLLVPSITMLGISVQLAKYMTKMTRLEQSLVTAAYAVAKEGERVDEAEKDRLAREYVDANMRAVRSRKDALRLKRTSSADNRERITATYTPQALFDRLASVALPYTFKAQATAVRNFKPLELVIVIDGSSSVSAVLPDLREGAARVVDEVFSITGDNTYISLVAYSGYVNIGWEYKDKLITPESRRIYYPEQRSALLGLGLDDDLLSPNGPEGVRRGACVLRPVYLPPSGAASGRIQEYVDNIEIPPPSPDGGFTLLMNDGRPVPLENYSEATKRTDLFLSLGLGAPGSLSVGRDRPFYVDEGKVTDVAAVPPEFIHPDEAKSPNNFYFWGETHTRNKGLGKKGGVPGWGEMYKNGVPLFVHVPWDCTTMPMLVASQDKQEILERIDTLKDMWTTGTDEGVAWAMRILSPNWRGIWERGDYPADYHDGRTTKRILLIGGSMTAGYFMPGNNAMSEMCARIKENGIEMYILVDESENPNIQSQRIYRECAGENYILAPNSQAFPELMERISARTTVIRLTDR
jgi:Flp pilus assembly protein TadG